MAQGSQLVDGSVQVVAAGDAVRRRRQFGHKRRLMAAKGQRAVGDGASVQLGGRGQRAELANKCEWNEVVDGKSTLNGRTGWLTQFSCSFVLKIQKYCNSSVRKIVPSRHKCLNYFSISLGPLYYSRSLPRSGYINFCTLTLNVHELINCL